MLTLDYHSGYNLRARAMSTKPSFYDSSTVCIFTREIVERKLTLAIELLMNYLTNVSFYLVLKASGTTGLKDHPVIDALVELRSQLEKTDQLEVKLQPEINAFMDRLDAPEKTATKKEASSTKKSAKKSSSSKKEKQQPVPASPELEEEDYMVMDDDQEEEEDEEEDDAIKAFDIEQEFKSLKKSSKAAKKRKRGMQDDFGELEALDEMDMEDKLAKKRSLRDYVAKIDAVSLIILGG